MTVPQNDRAYVAPRYFGPSTWSYAFIFTVIFAAMPPWPSSGGGWTLRIVLAMLGGVGGGLLNVWSDRRQERKLLAEIDAQQRP